MNKRVIGLLIAFLLAGALVIAISAAGGNGSSWVGAQPAVKVSPNNNVLAESNLALGPDNRVAVIWSSATAPHGVFLAQTQGSGWTPATVASTGNLETWNPAVAYFGTKAITAWVQGTMRNDRTKPRAVMQKDEGGLDAQTIITPVFGNVEIGLVVAPTGMHMIFAATTNSNTQKAPWDLYYTHRHFTETTWASPTIVITHAQVIPEEAWINSMTASILTPRMTVSSDGTQLNLVWQQEHTATPTSTTTFTRTIWYVSGTWQSGHVIWATPQQVSPPDQKLVLRPGVAVGSTGKVHIVWVEALQMAQHINYLQLDDPTPIRITGQAMTVNDAKPTWATTSIDANGNQLCVTWHGYYTGAKEESVMRCSHNEGETWQPLINISESQEWFSLFPTVKIDAANMVHVVWTEYSLVGISLVPNGLYYRTGTSDVTNIFLPLVLRRK